MTIYGDGGQTRDYVFVGDVVRANMAAVASNGIGRVQRRHRGRDQRQPALRGTRRASPAPTGRPSSVRRAPGEQRRSVISPARAAKELGWRPQVELADGLAQTLRFFRDRAAR